ncbi:MAG TPA: NFACT family protein [Candidatus Bilamarchaeaceae archaeon]|nr:NFACT family protein [Candidatus Bilamarchaeaceae archaeon]
MSMRPLENLEYAYMVQELQPLAGRHFSKIYDLGENKLRLKINNHDIIVHLGYCLYIARHIPASSPLSNFSQKVRKELEGKKTEKIYQLNDDRIIIFDFGSHLLIFEMFAKGNALLVFEDKIMACYRNEQWKDRILKPGQPYIPPPKPGRMPEKQPIRIDGKPLSERIEQSVLAEPEENPLLEKLDRRLQKQKAALAQKIEEEKEMKQKGDYLFAQYEKVQALLKLAQEKDWDTLERQNVKIDPKRKTLEADL